MLKQVLRFLAPTGLLEILRARRTFEKVHFAGGNSWRAALSPSLRSLLASSHLEFIPTEILRNSECVVDVGANVGIWSKAILELIDPPQLIAIEPSPDVFQELAALVGNNSKVKLVQCAIGAEQGKADFHTMGASEWNSLLPVREDIKHYYPVVEDRGTLTVDVMRLDELLQDVGEITLLKIDIQGGESALMDGASETMKRTRAVLLEVNFVSHYQGDTLFADLNRRMTKEFGFELYRIANPYHNSDGKILWANAVYINPDMASHKERLEKVNLQESFTPKVAYRKTFR